MAGVDQRPATPQPLPDIRYRGDLLVFEPAVIELRERFGQDPRVQFGHLASYHGDFPIVEVVTPFVFDRRQFPGKYRGLWLLHDFSDVPEVFGHGESQDRFSPRSIENFVDSEADQIREQLGNPEMSRDQILDALSTGLSGLLTIAGGFEGYRRAYDALRK